MFSFVLFLARNVIEKALRVFSFALVFVDVKSYFSTMKPQKAFGAPKTDVMRIRSRSESEKITMSLFPV